VSILVSNSDVISKMQTIATVHLSWITIQNGNCVLEHQFVAQATGPSVRSPQANCPISWTFELQFGQIKPANEESPASASCESRASDSPALLVLQILQTRDQKKSHRHGSGSPRHRHVDHKTLYSLDLAVRDPDKNVTQVLACVRPFFDWSFSHSTMISYDI
jgi:hypothetical protein